MTDDAVDVAGLRALLDRANRSRLPVDIDRLKEALFIYAPALLARLAALEQERAEMTCDFDPAHDMTSGITCMACWKEAAQEAATWKARVEELETATARLVCALDSHTRGCKCGCRVCRDWAGALDAARGTEG